MRDCQICTTFLKDRVAVECARVRSSSDRELDRVAIELIWTTYWIGIALIGKRSGLGQIEVELIGCWSVILFIPTKLDLYTIFSRSSRPLLNQYPIISQWLFERLASRSLLELFEHVQNFRVGSRSDAEKARPPWPLLPSELYGSKFAWSIGSGKLL